MKIIIPASLTAALLLSACATQSSPPQMTPPGEVSMGPGIQPASGVVLVLYATDREPNTPLISLNENTLTYGVEQKLNGLRYGSIPVFVSQEHVRGEMDDQVWIELKPREVSADKFYGMVQREVNDSPAKDVFVFIHGFNNTFDDAIRRTAQLHWDLRMPGAAVCFDWASRGGGPMNYADDLVRGEIAEENLMTFLRDLTTRSDAQRIHLVAHSMGARVLLNALKDLDEEGTPLHFNDIVLASPDFDAIHFQAQYVDAVLAQTDRLSIYASERDNALIASRRVYGDRQRLGQAGQTITVIAGADTIDTSRRDYGWMGSAFSHDLNHSDYSKAAIDDLHQLIYSQLSADQRGLERVPYNDLAYWRQ